MPIYVYHCEKCKKNIDLELSISKRNSKQYCDVCKEIMERRYHGVKTGLQFGKGFFNTGGY